jgi:hypothetical protein
MSDIVNPFGNGEEKKPEYDLMLDQAEFATELTRAIQNHPRLPPAMVCGALFMLAQDIHHQVLSNVQQMAMAQDAIAKVNANRIKPRLN